jgi:hypothetical protein
MPIQTLFSILGGILVGFQDTLIRRPRRMADVDLGVDLAQQAVTAQPDD